MKSSSINNLNYNSLCYICLEHNNINSISPCMCNNHIHIECLLHWINTKKNLNCEICKSKYNLSSHSYNNYINSYIDDFTDINFEIDTNNNDRNIYNNLVNNNNNLVNNTNNNLVNNNNNIFNYHEDEPIDICTNRVGLVCVIIIIIIAIVGVIS